MSGVSSASRRLHKSLRSFLVEARLGSIDSSTWHSLKDDILAELETEDEGVLVSAIKALEKEKSCILPAESRHCFNDIKDLARRHNRGTLLDSLGRDQGSNASRVAKRRRIDTQESNSLTLSPRKSNKSVAPSPPHVGSSSTTARQSLDPYTTGFYLLKTLQVADQHKSLALDDIIVAGATLGVICNFKFDVAWMWDRAPALQTYQKILIVHGGGTEEEADWRQFFLQEGVESRVRFVRPKTPPYGTVHSKIMVLFYPTTCRVCIHTANMIQADWDCKTQGAYMRDFPLSHWDGRDDDSCVTKTDDPFKVELIRYFEHCLSGDGRRDFLSAINRYDFSRAGVQVVASVPGIHIGPEKNSYGHARLREIFRNEPFLHNSESSTVVCQFSSLGSLQEKWLDEEFHTTLFTSTDSERSLFATTHKKDQIKLVFPTVQQVCQSNEGVLAGLSLPVRSKNLHRNHITRKLCRWEAVGDGRDKAMPHIKTYLRYPNSRPDLPCWLFLGSFNLSVAAWGRMQGRKGKKEWDRLNLLSYELGVLFLPRTARTPSHSLPATVKYVIQTIEKEPRRETEDAAVKKFTSLSYCPKSDASCQDRVIVLPLPYRVPPPSYRIDDIPWTLDFCN